MVCYILLRYQLRPHVTNTAHEELIIADSFHVGKLCNED